MTSEPAFEFTVSGIPLWLMREYLVELGGQQVADDIVNGEGWQAHLTKVEDFQIGSLRVGRVHLHVHGNAEALETLRPALEKKLVRAGG
jgi:Domain of unknown function (DUF1952)